ncbi:cytochrome c biogenesis protein CcsA [Compostibacter hankyongensis]|uniref:Cytochrome c biogenesis protein CcsA n=1 Tax=Compostibacter hankyongensis TaxID=1007089 RepID=A0ABP8FNX5_9BACT
METKYIGEHLLPGQLGHFFVLLAFTASMVATVAYFAATRAKEETQIRSWKRLARTSFFIQLGAVFAVFATIYYLFVSHRYEYFYVFEHTNQQLPAKYLLSAFWEGQEGSFLLWSIWHCILGTVLICTDKKWEAPVMGVVSFAQVCLASMLLGIYFFGYKVGSDPFILFRHANPNMPLFGRSDYVSHLTNGNGLNPLLQNYWMVIHPPVLFCGFASTIIPFAYAFAGLWQKDFGGWVKAALPWALFSAMILGTGIMMGAAWAYESLTFGGYWAWDPVENASLVPWLTLVAGIHTLLIYKHSGHSLRSTFFFFFITFILILYSTFLTRSGILGDTSVHAFTDLGMSGQLLVYMALFTLPAIWLFIRYYKKIPAIQREEATHSREFWMFIGSLVLFLSALFITFTTSIPVWNKLFGLDMAPPVDQKFHYNKIQVFVGVLIALGTAMVQYLKYKSTPRQYFLRKIGVPTVVAAVLATLLAFFGGINYRAHGIGFLIALYLLLYATVYAVVANAAYISVALKGKMKAAGASVAHVGFGLMLLGILISSSRQQTISLDQLGVLEGYFGKGSPEEHTSRENIYLPRNTPMHMADYRVTYQGDSTAAGDPKTYYKVWYEKLSDSDRVAEAFHLYPDAFINPKGQEGLIPNPDSKHYWNRDIFTYVTAVHPSEQKDTAQYVMHDVQPGDTIFFSNGYMLLERINTRPESPKYHPEPGDMAIGADLKVYTQQDETFTAMPIYYLRDSSYQYSIADTIPQLSLYVKFQQILPQERKIRLAVKQSDTVSDDYIVLKAYVFPYINVLWLGILTMIAGFLMCIRQRVRQRK